MGDRMRALGWTVVLLATTGCSDVGGTWVGTCDYGDARYGYSSAVEVKMIDGTGSQIQGELLMTMHDGRTFEGNLTGLRSDTWIELEAPIRLEDGTFEITMEGTIEENVIEGECRVRIPLGAGALVGQLLLER